MKKLIIIFLAVLLTVSVFPGAVFAASNKTTVYVIDSITNNDSSDEWTTDITYNKAGYVSKVKNYVPNSTQTYTYNSENQLTKAVQKITKGDLKSTRIRHYTWKNNAMTKMTDSLYGGHTYKLKTNKKGQVISANETKEGGGNTFS